MKEMEALTPSSHRGRAVVGSVPEFVLDEPASEGYDDGGGGGGHGGGGDDYGRGRCGNEEPITIIQQSSTTFHQWEQLPGLPRPHPNQREQVQRGVLLVLFATTLTVSLCEVTTRLMSPGLATRLMASAVEVLAIVAILCFAFLCFSTAHLLPRTAQTANPIPPAVVEALARGKPSELPSRNLEGDDGRTYCVRCMVWRPAGVKSHHCRVCNRCCVHFDHHCHILGRCIAGSGVRGNLLPFRLLLVSTAVGVLLCLVTVLVGAMRLLDAPEPGAAALSNGSAAMDGSADALADAWPQGVRMGVCFGVLAGVLLLLVLSCKIIVRFCEGAKQLSERSHNMPLAELPLDRPDQLSWPGARGHVRRCQPPRELPSA